MLAHLLPFCPLCCLLCVSSGNCLCNSSILALTPSTLHSCFLLHELLPLLLLHLLLLHFYAQCLLPLLLRVLLLLLLWVRGLLMLWVLLLQLRVLLMLVLLVLLLLLLWVHWWLMLWVLMLQMRVLAMLLLLRVLLVIMVTHSPSHTHLLKRLIQLTRRASIRTRDVLHNALAFPSVPTAACCTTHFTH